MIKTDNTNEAQNLKELALANTIQIDTIARLLIEKGIFTKDEYLEKMRDVQTEYFNQVTA